MPWLELTIVPAEHADPELLSELLFNAGANSVTLLDSADQAIFEPEPGATPLWQQTKVVGLFDTEQAARQFINEIKQTSLIDNHDLSILNDKDWQNCWKEHFKASQFGTQLWICPSWQTPPDPEACNILLDPGLAFGTGSHATTSLCLNWLAANPPLDKTVIDYGCGSGILAIAASKLGAKCVYAVDIDPQALTATRQNAEQNNITATQLITCLASDLLPVKTDVLIANILANPLLKLATTFTELTRHQLVLSGILQDQAEQVASHYRHWFDVLEVTDQEEWSCISAIHKQFNPLDPA